MGQAEHNATSDFFYSEDEAAVDWHMSTGGLAAARSRKELEGAFVTVGRRVLYSRIRPRIVALGLSDPADLGRFCAGAGISDLVGLLDFLGEKR
jgi:hypothetical protein